MSFFSKFKTILGFGGEGYDDENADHLLDDDGGDGSENVADSSASEQSPEHNYTAPEIDPVRQRQIFDSVLEVFNSALPDFLSRCLNTEEQSAYLYDSLGQSLKDYLNSLANEAEAHAEHTLHQRQEAVKAEMERLKEEVARLEQQRSTIKEQQLSSDRRRRALTDRVKDLEAQVAALEAEREQFQLENKSLLNKIKLSEIQPGIIDELNAEIARLKESAQSETPIADNTATETLKAELQTLRDENGTLAQKVQMLTEQHQSATEMVNDLQHHLVAERKSLAAAQAELDEAHRLIADVEELKEQMLGVQELIAKRDERIARLKAENKNLKKRIETFDAESKDHTDDGRQRRDNQARKDAVRRAENGPNLFSGDDEPDDKATEGTPLPSDISAETLAEIDDDFEAADWFVSVPPEGTKLRSEIGESDFGYHEPPRRPAPPENDAQLSLF